MTELAVQGEQFPAIPDDLIGAGMEDFERADLIVPRYMRRESGSKFTEGELGWFVNNITRSAKTDIKAVMLRFTHGRAMFDRKGNLLCRSDDSRNPTERFAGEYAKICSECEHANWGKDRTRPNCPIGYNFLCWDLDEDTPFMLSMRGMSVRHAKRILSEFKLRFKSTLFARPVLISSIGPMEGDLGVWYETVITVDEEAAKTYDWRPFHEKFVELREFQVTAEAEESTDDEEAEIVEEEEGGNIPV